MKNIEVKQNFFSFRKNSIKTKIISTYCFILMLILIFSCASSILVLKTSSYNVINCYGKTLTDNFLKTFNLDAYLEFIKYPSVLNPNYDKCKNQLEYLKKLINATNVYIITLDQNQWETVSICLLEDDNFLPPGYVLRKIPTDIVRQTYKKKRFIKTVLINNSWGEYYSFYTPIFDRNKDIVSLFAIDLDNSILNKIVQTEKVKILKFIISFSLILYTLSLIVVVTSISKVMKPVKTTKQFLSVIATGDLTKNLNSSIGNDEFSQIQNLFIKMIYNIKSILNSIIHTSKEINVTFENVERKKVSITTNISNINSLTFNILDSNEKIFSNTNKVKDEFLTFNLSIKKMSNEIYDIKKLSQNTQTICSENTDNIQSFILEISPLIKKFENFKENTMLLNDFSTEITQILKEINEIATQTKLLALNASIVAASAGEHGDGFSVVAQEISELSHKTGQSVSLIQDTLATVTKTISYINSETINTSNIFKEHATKSSMFSKNLSSINNLSLNTSKLLENLSSKSDIITEKNNSILKSVKYINEQSKLNNDTLKSISNSTNKLLNLSNHFKKEFKKITKYIQNIKKSHEIFKIEKEE